MGYCDEGAMMRYLSCILLLCITTPVYAVDITECGTLSTAGTTYVLQNNVVSEGTCFSVTASDIVLDLNGKTVIYDNAAPIAVPNGSFESTLSGSWDVTGADNTTRAEGTYLTPSVYVGNYALKVATPTANQQVQSVGTVTLQPDTTYSLSGMVYNQVADAVQMSIGFDGTAIAATQTARTYRGFQYIYTQFTTGGSEVSYKINLSITGASSVASGSVYFDDIRVQQTAHHGVKSGNTTGPVWARNNIIKNGTIIQGQAHGDWSHAISMEGTNSNDNPNYEIRDLNILVSGNSSKGIIAPTVTNATIHHNSLNSAVDTIEYRDHSDGSLVYIYYTSHNGSIHSNIIPTGIQCGIYAKSDGGVPISIYDNSITLQSKYANDFAIIGDRSNIYNNTINCGSGDNTCRGILSAGDGGSIYNNIINVHYKKNNQEYYYLNGGCGGSAYGIQLEETAQNIEVYGNTVTANADECEAVAFRPLGINAEGYNGNYVHDNTFIALAVNGSSKIASSIMCMETYKEHMTITNNILDTNSNWLRLDGINVLETTLNRSFSMDSNSFKLTLPKASSYYPLLSKTYSDGSDHPRNVTLSNNIYETLTIQSDVEAGFVSSSMSFATDPYAYNIIITEGDPVDPPPSTSIIRKFPGGVRCINGHLFALPE